MAVVTNVDAQSGQQGDGLAAVAGSLSVGVRIFATEKLLLIRRSMPFRAASETFRLGSAAFLHGEPIGSTPMKGIPMTETQENKVPARRRHLITGGAVALAMLAGGAGIAAAQGTPKPPGSSSSSNSTAHHDEGDKADTTFKSSVTSPEQPEAAENESETPAQETQREAAETASLAKLAKVTSEQARDVALRAVPGTIVYEDGAKLPQVSNDDGNVVYEVTIKSANGKTETELIIDAGNAKVLATEVGQAEAHAGLGN